MAVHLPAPLGADLGGREHLSALVRVVTGHGDGHSVVLRQIGGHGLAGQDLLQRLGVGLEGHVQRAGQGLTLRVVALYRDNPVQTVEGQLQGGVHIHADGGHRHQQGVIPTGAQQHQQTGRRGRNGPAQTPSWTAAGRGFLSGVGQEGHGALLQLRLDVDAVKGGAQLILHIRHLPACP